MNSHAKIKEWIDNRWGGSKYFRKSFLMILFITSIPGIISAIGIYTFGLHSTEDELRKIHVDEINERVQNIDEQFNYLEESLSYWAFEPSFNSTLMDTNFVRQFQKTRDLKQKLLILQGSHPLIDEVELFIDGEEPVLFSPYLDYISNKNLIKAYESLLRGSKNVTWSHDELFVNDTRYTNEIVLTHQIPGGVVKNPFDAIIVKVDKTSLASILGTLTPYSDGMTMLLNESNKVLLSTAREENQSLSKLLSEELMQQKENTSSFQLDWEDKTYSVSYGEFDRIGSTWTYVSAAPISAITSPIVTISKVILIASLSILLLAFLMTWFASNRLYQPVRNLVNTFAKHDIQNGERKTDEFTEIHERFNALSNERRYLEERLSEQIPQLRQNFLVQLTKGYLYDFSENSLNTRMENYGWIVKNHTFILIDIQLTGMYELAHKNADDDSLVTFAMSNMAEDITKEYFNQYTIINHYDLSAGIFLIVPSHIQDLRSSLHQLSEKIISAINKVLALKVTITISSQTEKVKQISYLFDEIGRGKRYRKFENQNQIIHLNDLNERMISQSYIIHLIWKKKLFNVLEEDALVRRKHLFANFLIT